MKYWVRFLPFSYFRADAIELERLKEEAKNLTRRKTEAEHAEERQVREGKLIDHTKTFIS